MNKRYFLVTSMDYDVVEEVYYGQGPTYTVRDCWEGYAANRAEARSLAWKAWRADGLAESLNINRGDRRHPMTGVTVKEWLPCPIHGAVDAGSENDVAFACGCNWEEENGVYRWVSEDRPVEALP